MNKVWAFRRTPYSLDMCCIFQYRTKNEQRLYFLTRSDYTWHNCHRVQFKVQLECDMGWYRYTSRSDNHCHGVSALYCTAKPKSPAVWACLGVDPPNMPRTGERTKTLSITHHALSPPPSHHHLYIILSHQLTTTCYRITMSLKRPFVPKSDVKQWFTTTTAQSVRIIYNVSIYVAHISSLGLLIDPYMILSLVFGPVRSCTISTPRGAYSSAAMWR